MPCLVHMLHHLISAGEDLATHVAFMLRLFFFFVASSFVLFAFLFAFLLLLFRLGGQARCALHRCLFLHLLLLLFAELLLWLAALSGATFFILASFFVFLASIVAVPVQVICIQLELCLLFSWGCILIIIALVVATFCSSLFLFLLFGLCLGLSGSLRSGGLIIVVLIIVIFCSGLSLLLGRSLGLFLSLIIVFIRGCSLRSVLFF